MIGRIHHVGLNCNIGQFLEAFFGTTSVATLPVGDSFTDFKLPLKFGHHAGLRRVNHFCEVQLLFVVAEGSVYNPPFLPAGRGNGGVCGEAEGGGGESGRGGRRGLHMKIRKGFCYAN